MLWKVDDYECIFVFKSSNDLEVTRLQSSLHVQTEHSIDSLNKGNTIKSNLKAADSDWKFLSSLVFKLFFHSISLSKSQSWLKLAHNKVAVTISAFIFINNRKKPPKSLFETQH